MEEALHLTDLIDAQTLQRIQDAFSGMTGMAALTTDADGIPVTKGSNFSDFCMEHVRCSEDGHIRCEQCDKFGAEDSWKRGGSSAYYCHAGLIDYAAPILAGEQMIGSIIGGQVLTEPPDREHIYQIAWELGINPITLWEAAQKIRIMDRQKIEDAAQFLFTIANALSDMAYGKYRMLQANHEIERANNMKSDFLANMSHEIRTPMNAVIGMAEMALREDISPTVREYLGQIKKSSSALLTIINDILDFSKIESGKMDIVPVEYDAMSIVNDIANIVVERIKDKDVELIMDIAPDIPHMLLGDNIRIKQILLNLVNNAAKFTQSGQVAMRMAFTHLSKRKINLQFTIEDTGIGIKEEDLANIFDSFRQVDAKRNRNIEGTGLGLAISRQLTLLMDGMIYVKSQYGAGSTFFLEIPQEVVDDTPSCVVREPEKIQAFGFLEDYYVKLSLLNDCMRFGVEYCDIEALGDIVIDTKREQFLFIENEIFDEKAEAFLRANPSLTAVLLYSYPTVVREYDLPNMLIVRKPLCSINEANIFNRDDLFSQESELDAVKIDFVAPAAKVLIVDDNTVNLVVTEGLLEPLKMQIDTATGGREALEKITNVHYDLILMDHMMPDMDGVETTHVIRREHPNYDDVPIIALTANAMSGMKEQFLKEGMTDYVSKPIELKNLLKKVAIWLPKEKVEKRGEDEIITDRAKEAVHEIIVSDLDTASAIRMMGSEKLYWAVLKDYYRMIEAKAQRIRKLEQEEDWANYTIEVHSLKSTSRQIGAVELSEAAAALEKAGNEGNGSFIHEKTEPLLDKYLSYQTELAPFCAEQEETDEKEEITFELLSDFFERMENATAELDMDGMEEVLEQMKGYRYDSRQKLFFDHLAEAVENVDVDACEVIMNDWKTAMGGV